MPLPHDGPDFSQEEFLRLLVDARRGDQAALGALMCRYRLYLLKIAEEEADSDWRDNDGNSDFVQDTFVKALAAFRSFRGDSPGELRAWLKMILRHHLNDERKRKRAAKRDVKQKQSLQAFECDSRNENLKDPAPSPSQVIVANEEQRALRDALGRLEETDRMILSLRFKSLSFNEVARAVHLSVDATQKRWARAVQALCKRVGRGHG